MRIADEQMTSEEALTAALDADSLARAHDIVADVPSGDIVSFLGRSPSAQQAVLFRLLPKDKALDVFEGMTSSAQAQLVGLLRDDEVATVFADMDPDDRVGLIDELPALVAKQLMRGLSPAERGLTGVVLGYPDGSIGRRMSPEVVSIHEGLIVAEALDKMLEREDSAETIYLLPVIDDGRRVTAVVSLRDLVAAAPDALVEDLASSAECVQATDPEEDAARRCADGRHLAMPVVDSEGRLVGIFTVDDALRILDEAASEDQARQGGSEPLRGPYLATSIFELVKSRLVWLLVLAIGATLTVRVLEGFESTLSKMVVLSVFVPLLIGTGGNTGNQAATTVTRALALGEVRPRDALRIAAREATVGACLGLVLGSLGFGIVTLIYGWHVGLVIGLTLLSVCTLAAMAGGLIPLVARLMHADPAVFSNPFISTLLDATGLIIYFLIAQTILGL